MFSFITRTGVNNSCPAFCMSRTKWPLLVPRKLHPKRASYHGCQVRESPKTFNWWSDSDSYMPYKTNILSSPNQYVASTGRPAMLQNLKFLSKRVALFSCFKDRRFLKLCYSEGSCFPACIMRHHRPKLLCYICSNLDQLMAKYSNQSRDPCAISGLSGYRKHGQEKRIGSSVWAVSLIPAGAIRWVCFGCISLKKKLFLIIWVIRYTHVVH